MRLPEFEMERLQSTWEKLVRYDLSESGLEALTFAEAAGDLGRLREERLGYADGRGREPTRALVAALHEGTGLDGVLLTTGTSEANFLALATLVEPGDEVAIVMPNYMQLHGIARGLGATVREVWLREADGWRLDVDELRAAVTARTRVLCVCNPNNPTGQVLTEADMAEVASLVERTGAWLLADEVYRGAERTGGETASFVGRAGRVVATGGLSKAYGLPGLRIGWVVSTPDRVAACWAAKDYTTIATATVSELLAESALSRRPELLARSRSLLRERWPILESWAAAHGPLFGWTPPAAGAICFFRYTFPLDSVALVERLIRERSVLVVPGAHFLAERHLRIGFGMEPDVLRAGLAAIDGVLASLD
ncbi:MAG TPA: aminotransferase class I/II-fold pyridoxal phosphate-dependent enzyme [Candidatus Limnocylindrales bacterium]|nr:aminotransferase class I/II-fold pyridoxal phosphate-dependent enzyme [Candidatus Limnocylindrales bacterium]